VLDQASSEEITYQTAPNMLAMNARYMAVMEALPTPDREASHDQLTALEYVMSAQRPPYVDMSVFGRHGPRRARAMAFTGLTQGPGGTLRMVEILGPATLVEWKQSYDVLYTALIMLDAVRRPQLDQYRARICLYHAQYGERTWALLYQADVRCRQELMGRTRHRLEAAHNTAITAGKLSDFDTARPWDSVWKAVLADTEFWEVEYKTSALLIKAETIRPADVIGGDADIAAESAAASSAFNHVPRIPPGHAPRANPVKTGGPKNQLPIQRSHTSDNPPKPICRAYNLGTCRAKGLKCPAGNGDRVHVCYYCMGGNHMGKDCRAHSGGGAASPAAAAATPWKPSKSKRGKGKNKNGGGKWT
jgi:hypothetical protein